MHGRRILGRSARVKRARLPVVTRIQGGFMGILSAIEAAFLDPEDPDLPEERFYPRTASEKRAADRRVDRREKKASRRRPF